MLSKYKCQHCFRVGATDAGMDIFIALLCPSCFWKLWKSYLRDASGMEWTDEQAHEALGHDYDEEFLEM